MGTIPLLLLLLALLPSCGGSGGAAPDGTTAYYVDGLSGDDGNTGRSATSPWRTLGMISGTQLPAGAVVYLKRGSTWHEQLTIGTSGVTIDAYGAGALPALDGAVAVSGWADQGGGIFAAGVNLGSGEVLGNLSENGILMSFLEWQGDAAGTLAAAPAGSYTYDNTRAMLFIKPASLPAGNTYRASVKTFGVLAEAVSDVTVRNIDISRFSLHGINFRDCVRCEVHDSVIAECGGATLRPNLYAGNGIEFGNASKDGVVDGVVVRDIFDSCISPQTYSSGKSMANIVIRNSQADTCGLAGIEISVLSNGGSTGSSISGVTISGTIITNAGRGWSGRRYATGGHGVQIHADSGAGAIRGVQIGTTTINGSAGDGVRLGGDIGTIRMERTEISNNENGIRLTEPAEASPKIELISSLVHHNALYGFLYNSPTASGFDLLQSTVADNSSINLAVPALGGTARVRNNLFYGSSPATDIYFAGAPAAVEIDNNCYEDHVNMFGYAGTAYSTVAAFTAGTGFEIDGTSGNTGLLDPAAGDYSLSTALACKASGSPALGVALDFSGYPFASPPSSGAYQFR